MDMINLAYYAVICAILSVAAPHLGKRWVRLAVGACVGLLGAAALPTLRQAVGVV